jgi:hypothetical protein
MLQRFNRAVALQTLSHLVNIRSAVPREGDAQAKLTFVQSVSPIREDATNRSVALAREAHDEVNF